jgi:CBS domain-containing protein
MHFSVKDVIDDLGSDWELVTITGDVTVSEGLDLMREKKVISLPVLRETNGPFEGIIDMLDLVTYCSTKFTNVSVLAQESYRQMEEFAAKPVRDLLDISGRNAWVYISYKEILCKLFHLLTKHHRVAVVNESYDVIGVITQSKLVEFLYKNRRLFPDTMHKRVDILQKPVESIHMKAFVIEGFRTIWEHGVSGLAVINDEGVLVGNLSATDLLKTHVKPTGEMIHDLYQPIKQMLNIREDLKDRIMMADLPECRAIAVTADDTLETSMKKCIDNGIHRVFIQDDKRKPVGVISLGDVIHQFVK